MNFEVITIFPKMFESPFDEGVVGQAIHAKQIGLDFVNPRQFAKGTVHKSVDDKPYGGGDGMVMMAEPLLKAMALAESRNPEKAVRRIYLSPQGRVFNDAVARELAGYDTLILICGRYGGVDERFLRYVDEELSVGDFVLSGGELAAMTVIDTVSRLIPGVLGHADSSRLDSFANSLLEAPQFTRPREFNGMEVPEILLSGDHANIEEWRRLTSLAKTLRQRPDLAERLTNQNWKEVETFLEDMPIQEKIACGLIAEEGPVDLDRAESPYFQEDVGL